MKLFLILCAAVFTVVSAIIITAVVLIVKAFTEDFEIDKAFGNFPNTSVNQNGNENLDWLNQMQHNDALRMHETAHNNAVHMHEMAHTTAIQNHMEFSTINQMHHHM